MLSSLSCLPPFQIKFDGENLFQVPSDLEMLENQLAGRHPSGIKNSYYENPLGAVREILYENQLVGE